MTGSLQGPTIRLRPLQRDDGVALAEAVADGELWHCPYTIVPTPQAMDEFVATALERQAAGLELPYVIEHAASGQLLGAKRFRDPDAQHRRIEISHAWVRASWQRRGVNTEANYLMLRFAFDTLECIRVQFRSDADNLPSRHGLARLGAREEGLLRNERIMPDGRRRDAVIYSVIDTDWPGVKAALEHRLGLGAR